MKRIFLTAMFLAAAGSAAAQDAQQEQAPQQGQAAAQEQNGRDPDKRVCKTEKITGSLTRVRRTCMTQREWDQLAQSTRDDVEDISRDANRGIVNNATASPVP
jgi:tryptophan 2,3-dioxygenase